MLTFLALWRAKKYPEGYKYAHLAHDNLRDLFADRNLKKATQLNLLGIVSLSLAVVEIKTTGDSLKAVNTVELALEKIEGSQVPAELLLKKFMKNLHQESDAVWPMQTSSRSSFGNFSPLKSDFADPNYSLLDASYSQFARNRPEVDRDLFIPMEFEEVLFITVFVVFISPHTPLIQKSELEAARDSRLEHARDSKVDPFVEASTSRSLRTRSQATTPRAFPKIETTPRNIKAVKKTVQRIKPTAHRSVAPRKRSSSISRKPSEARSFRRDVSASLEGETDLFRKIPFTKKYNRRDLQFNSEPRRRTGNSRLSQPRQRDSSRLVYLSPNLENAQLSTSFSIIKTKLTPLRSRPKHREPIMLEFNSDPDNLPQRRSIKRSLPPVSSRKRFESSVQKSGVWREVKGKSSSMFDRV